MNFIQTTTNPKNTENPVSHTGQAPGLFNPYVPLTPSADTLPAFPIHCLPPRLQSYVAAVAEHTQTPVDMAAGIALGVLATCLQGKVRVEGNPGHYEQTSLYVFIVANPGARKSAVIRAMTAVIEDYEQAYNERLKPQIRKRRQEREALQRQINRLNRQLEQKYDSMTELELQHAQDNLADLSAIQPLQIFTDDCTSEMMVRLLKDNGGRMALISAEGGAFDAIIGRYSKKPNLDVWLKGICGDTIRVDRLNREPDYVRHPAVSMILTAQPSVLSEIMQNGMLDGRGFLARFLYVNIPPAAVPRSFQSAPIPQDVQEDYRELIHGLLSLPPETDIVLHLSPEAVELMEGVCNGLEQYLIHEARDMREWGSKLIGLVLRIAGLIHVASGLTGDISADTIRRAICIGRYAFQHAMYAYSIISADETIEKALHVVSRLRKHRIRDISQSVLYQLCRGRFFRDAKELVPALELLEQHGYIWRDTPLYSGVSRPPSRAIHAISSMPVIPPSTMAPSTAIPS